MSYLIGSKFIITMGFVGLANSAVNPLFPVIPYHPFTQPHVRSCMCVCVCMHVCDFIQYPELQLAPECCTCQVYKTLYFSTSLLWSNSYKIQHIILTCYKGKHWSVTESQSNESLENNFKGRDTEFSIVLPLLNITLYQVFWKILRS